MKIFVLLLTVLAISACATMTVTFESNKDPNFAGGIEKLYAIINTSDIKVEQYAWNEKNEWVHIRTDLASNFLKEIVEKKFYEVGIPIKAKALTGLELSKDEINTDISSFKSSSVMAIQLTDVTTYVGSYGATSSSGKFEVSLYQVDSDKVIWKGKAQAAIGVDGLNALIIGLIDKMKTDGLILALGPAQ